MKISFAHVPFSPGVYLMKGNRGEVLYIGKAANLKRRVSSYFAKPQPHRIRALMRGVVRIDYEQTDTVIEALLRESALIKRYQPKFNVREKDDKSFLTVEITNEKFPRVLLTRGRTRPFSSGTERFGPFTSSSNIVQALRIIRKVFPFSTHFASSLESSWSGNGRGRKPCFDYELGLCPGTCIGAITRRAYLRNVNHVKLFFQGRKAKILESLQYAMQEASEKLEFEIAEKLKRQIFALRHIQDIAVLSESQLAGERGAPEMRIEGYDISHIAGTGAVGSMVVFNGANADTDAYRRFKITTVKQSDDVAMLKEILRRRFRNAWPLPDLILVDGGAGQVHAAEKVLEESGLRIPVVGIAKGLTRKKNELRGRIPRGISKKILIKVRDEAHRFAIRYHRYLQRRTLLSAREKAF